MASWMDKVTEAFRTTSISPSSSTNSSTIATMQASQESQESRDQNKSTSGHRRVHSAGSNGRAVTGQAAHSTRNRASYAGNRQSNTPAPIPRAMRYPRLAQPTVHMGNYSSPAIPDGMYFASNFMTGVGLLIIQPSTGKVVVVNEPNEGWFFPKGRKDVGESLMVAALREGYEESGYRATLMPLPTPTQAPYSPEAKPAAGPEGRFNTEPIYVSTHYWGENRYRREPGIYFTFWFVGEIPEDAEHHTGTGMADEQQYVTHLLDPVEALAKLGGVHEQVLRMGYALWQDKISIQSEAAAEKPTSVAPQETE